MKYVDIKDVRKKALGNPEHIDQCAIITGEIAAETARLIKDELSNKSYKA